MLVSHDGRRKALLNLLEFSLWIITCCHASNSDNIIHDGMDILSPFLTDDGPRHRTHRDIQTCQDVTYGNVTHSLHPAVKHPTTMLPLVETHIKIKEVGAYYDKKYPSVHHFIVNNPLTTLSVLEPGHHGSCKNINESLATVRKSSRQKNCLASVNGGLFNPHTGGCLGNIVTDGFLVQDSGGVQNAHFGITEKGNIYTGYLSELDLLTQGFTQLVGGVIWLVRDGKNYVDESKKLECPDTETTGSIDRFVDVISARTAIGHDREGRVHIIQIDGKTYAYGINLYDMADFLIELGVINAINLDGGGSSTAVVNGTLVNTPSDECPDKMYNCERAVSTIVCIHEPTCLDNCSGHGVCEVGVCHCRKPWMGPVCGELDPAKSCGSHGTLHEDICQCSEGWTGENCTLPCSPGRYGANCSYSCLCARAKECDIITGACRCGPGYIGKYCEKKCPYGYYGHNCAEVCFCRDSCFCNPESGSCNVTNDNEDYIKAGSCIARKKIADEELVPNRQGQYSLCLTSLVCLTIVAAASLVLNVVFSILMLKRRKSRKAKPRVENIHMKRIRRRRPKKPNPRRLLSSSSDVENPVPNGILGIGRVEEDQTLTGSGEDEEDIFLSRKKSTIS